MPVAYGDLTLGPGDLDAAVERLADRLRTCVRASAGERVAIIAPNSPAAVIGMFAAWRAGAVAVPLSARLREYDLARVFENAEPTAVVSVAESGGFSFAGAIPDVPSLQRTIFVDATGEVVDETASGNGATAVAPVPEGTGAILYTSGTTGAAKGVLTAHAALDHEARELGAALELTESDSCVLVIPVQHAFGLACLLAAVAAGSKAVLVESSTSLRPLLEALDRHRATVLHGSPLLWASLLKALPGGVPTLRTGLTGGSSCPPELMERLDATGAAILNCWGMTEIGAAAVCRRDDPPQARRHSVGRAVPGYELRIAAGEVQVRGPHVTSGYQGAPALTAEAFDGDWLRTGDLGTIDESGYLSIAGRAKDVVHVAGFSVFPAEVEGFLLTHPDVRQAAVVGVANERRGEALQAFVVPREGAALTPGDLLRYARPRIAGYKLPYSIVMVEELPLLPSGKPDRVALTRSATESVHAPR